MSVFDVRKEDDSIEVIVFSEATNFEKIPLAYEITPEQAHYDMSGNPLNPPTQLIVVRDSTGDLVWVDGKEHALNLIKALHKAIELEWVV